MKQGKKRTMSICLTDIDKSRIMVHTNGKKYLNLSTWDNDQPDRYDNDFSVWVSPTKEEIDRIKAGEKVDRNFVGNGRIWEPVSNMKPLDPDSHDDDDLAF